MDMEDIRFVDRNIKINNTLSYIKLIIFLNHVLINQRWMDWDKFNFEHRYTDSGRVVSLRIILNFKDARCKVLSFDTLKIVSPY